MAFVNLIDRLYALVLAIRADITALQSGGGGFSGLPYLTQALSADVNLPTTGTWYDGPAVTLTPGTWLVMAALSCTRTTTTGTSFIARIWDGSAAVASTQGNHPSLAGAHTNLSTHAVVVVAADTTFTAQATTSSGSSACSLKAQTTTSGSGNHASRISAVRIAP